ncbi:hypothetical protein B0H13DRAFT_2654789 [Mycena leptocephala]|nr:hypothetical protein B0H13DRAFT_2654789 [Mycena leptocephala]
MTSFAPSDADRLRIAIALTALKFKPTNQSCVSYVLQLRSIFIPSTPAAPTTDGSLSLEKELAGLEEKYEAEQINPEFISSPASDSSFSAFQHLTSAPWSSEAAVSAAQRSLLFIHHSAQAPPSADEVSQTPVLQSERVLSFSPFDKHICAYPEKTPDDFNNTIFHLCGLDVLLANIHASVTSNGTVRHVFESGDQNVLPALR